MSVQEFLQGPRFAIFPNRGPSLQGSAVHCTDCTCVNSVPAEWEVSSEELCILTSWFLSPMSKYKSTRCNEGGAYNHMSHVWLYARITSITTSLFSVLAAFALHLLSAPLLGHLHHPR